MSDGNGGGNYRCEDCGVTVPVHVTNGRSMMNLEGPDCNPPGNHSWSLETGIDGEGGGLA